MADGTKIDDLQIEIDASAENANKAIDNLVKKLDRLQTSLKTINGSQLVGIADSMYFCKRFKKIVGITPSKYRQKFKH